MKVGVSLKIDVSKIDKNRLFKGEKGMYLDATVFVDVDQLDQYGNSGMITQDVSKDEKQQGVKGNILGNCKVFWSDSNQQQAPQQNQYSQQQNQAPQNGYAPQQQQNNASYSHGSQQQAQQQGKGVEFSDDIPF